MAQWCTLCLSQVLLKYQETSWISPLRTQFPLLIMQPSPIKTSWTLEMGPGNHTPQKNSFRCGVAADLTVITHFNLNSRKSAERSSEGMRRPQAVMDLQSPSSSLMEDLHVVLRTLEESSKVLRIGWTNSWQIIPLRIIEYRETTYIQKATWLKVEKERDGKILGEAIILPCTSIFIKSIPLASTGHRMLKYSRPLVWYSFWSIGSQNSKKALQWADDVRLVKQTVWAAHTTHRIIKVYVSLLSLFRTLKNLHINLSGTGRRQKSAYLFAEKDSQS